MYSKGKKETLTFANQGFNLPVLGLLPSIALYHYKHRIYFASDQTPPPLGRGTDFKRGSLEDRVCRVDSLHNLIDLGLRDSCKLSITNERSCIVIYSNELKPNQKSQIKILISEFNPHTRTIKLLNAPQRLRCLYPLTLL